MSAQKPTASARKLDAWAAIRELDRRALALMAAGADLDAAYRKAVADLSRVPASPAAEQIPLASEKEKPHNVRGPS